MDLDTAKQRVRAEVERLDARLQHVAAQIHAHPELLYEETFAADLLASELEAAGLPVERGPHGIETAFATRTGRAEQGPTVAILCEYDALPGIGHGCGHNLIAAAGLGAGLAAAAVAAEAGGNLVVLGTPAEEGGGGKIRLIEAGAFDDVDVAMMVHPAGMDLSEADVIAIATWRVEYHGRGAHAAAYPERGRNALDAAVLGYNAVAALRQHIAPRERIHGIFLKAGDKPNIVPDHTVAEWYVRSPTMTSLEDLKERVLACLQAGAAAAECTMSVTPTCPEYSELRSNAPLLDLYRANSEAVGRPVPDPEPNRRVTVSTDMGNVSLAVPSIHPLLAVAPPEVALHTPDFAAWANGTPEARRAVLDGAAAMAMTAVDVWLRPEALQEIRDGFVPGP
ncbi:MAG: M20 family metallopeptidase [Acidimicrobiales bacterium]